MTFCRSLLSSLVLPLSLLSLPVLAQSQKAVPVKTVKITESISVLEGLGGNVAVLSGADGMIVIDDQYAVMTDNLKKALAAIGPQPLRFVINTHWHADHTGGNENFGKAGAVIVAHDQVRERLSTEQFMKAFGNKVPPVPLAALPVITFSEGVSFHLNNEDVVVTHVPNAHTDGDAIVRFTKANVLHTGDVFNNASYPFIDVSGGGSLNGVISAVGRLINTVDEGTKIIPGHGAVADRDAMIAYRDMLNTVRSRIKAAIESGKPLAVLLDEKPTAEFDARWGKGFLTPKQFVTIAHDSLVTSPND